MSKGYLRSVLAGAILFCCMASGTATASPSVGVDAYTVSQSSRDGINFIIRDVAIEPGGSTGWHWHDGNIGGVVKEGTLTHYASNCEVDGLYNAGDPITEPRGADHVHVGRNLGPTPVILEIIYVNPAATPLAVDAPNPGCPFS